ncbi:MAG: kynureninase [Candidatus Heimdallarchaeota archaeon]|nr:kynureninase [Candidatus Heimdallarchaeota archaeon]
MNYQFNTTEPFARELDNNDFLSKFREEFNIPENTIYVDGNSLGLMPKKSEECISRVVNEWKTIAINGWYIGKPSWFYFSEILGEKAAPLVGAKPNEVVATGTTTINLHALVSSFYTPTKGRSKILADVLNFPTDIYALKSQVMLKGYDPEEHLVLVPSKDGRFLDEDVIINYMKEDVALIVLPSVLYRSSQLLDIPRLTKEAHKRGILIGFDCSHSVGAVPHKFDEWGVDFAFWCSYKYMNGGPGAPAFLYVNEKHFTVYPALNGWFGNNKSTQFNMSLEFEPAKTAGQWQISSPGILGAAGIEGALEVTLRAGMDAIREKNIQMTSYLIYLVDELLTKEPYNFIVGTPRDESSRGSHIALERDEYSLEIFEALKAHGVVGDYRQKNIIRIAPAALYNTYHEIWKVVNILKNIIDEKEYEQYIKKA